MTDNNYFNEMVNTSQSLNQAYGYLWWLNGKPSFMVPNLQTIFPGFMSPNTPVDMISAIGAGGQFLNIVPSQNLVWLRMGDEPGNYLVLFLLNDQIWQYVNDLVCQPAGQIALEDLNQRVGIYPNPANNILNIAIDEHVFQSVSIYDSLGQMQLQSSEIQCTIEYLKNDYILRK
jgi:hypothetical protein